MANTTIIYKVFTDIVNAIQNGTDETKIYLMNRPDIADDSAKSFVIVDLPVQLNRAVLGGGDNFITTQGLISIFVKSRTDGTPNISAMTQKLDSMMKIFPINTNVCTCTDVRETLGGKDKYGYQYMILKFKIRTK